jgi:hypothetical protein
MLISKLNKLDTRRQQSRRHLNWGTVAHLSRVNYRIEAWKYKRIG